MVYLVLYSLGIITAGILTGIYGTGIGTWVSYSFIVVYGAMIIFNVAMIEKISELRISSSEEPLTNEQIKELPDELGEKKVGEAIIEEVDVPEEPVEEQKVPLSEEQTKIFNKIAAYIKQNLDKGHSLEKIRGVLDKIYKPEEIDFVIKNAFKIEEPELPELGEPKKEPELPELGEPKKSKKKSKKKKTQNKKVEIVDPEHFK